MSMVIAMVVIMATRMVPKTSCRMLRKVTVMHRRLAVEVIREL